MKISFAALNPCHMLPMAQAVADEGALGCYYSGYPAWRLAASSDLPIRTHSLRTNIVYGLLKFVPERLRPPSRALFLWQDRGFDRWTGSHLEPCNFIHGLPGQCVETFRSARRRGIRTVLNHASGPTREWIRIMEPEYQRVGLRLDQVCPYDDAYFTQVDEEYALSDWHCVASTVVRDQLIAHKVEPRRIWLIRYGADERIFHPGDQPPPERFTIVFAGQSGLRKGIRSLLQALTLAGDADWRMDFCGPVLGEARCDFDAYKGRTALAFHGTITQPALAAAFRAASVLVLPSLEEGFGLVVPQALNCGLPVIVSDRVGAKDLVRHRQNGSVIPTNDPQALARELQWWCEHPTRVNERFGWPEPVRTLIARSAAALN